MLQTVAAQAGERSNVAVHPIGQWSCCAHAPGTIQHPSQLENVASEWLPALVPGTVAEVLRVNGLWDFQNVPDIDARDWWFRTTFTLTEDQLGQPSSLCFDGLATLAEVWLNDERVLCSDNMFRRHRVDVASLLRTDNELAIGFRSLTHDLQKKRSRPRWKTNLVSHQQLRWHRTTLLGRVPGWSPPVPAIGPWRDVRLETRTTTLSDVVLRTRLEGTTGVVTFEARLDSVPAVDGASFQVGEVTSPLELTAEENGWRLSGELQIDDAPRWWPHTHGAQPLLDCKVTVDAGDELTCISCGRIGFRDLRVSTDEGFAIELNGEPTYCRGACWTVSDIFTLTGTEAQLRHDLTLARDAGANMLRIGGTMTYESDLFYRLCDELGLLVWQDFQFANMDYPVDDPSFAASIAIEATQQLQRLAAHPCVVVYCGNSEVEQQASMLGMPRELWRNSWFGDRLPGLCSQHHPGAAYVPSTPSGGVLPFQAREGICHYYGIGAYRRPLAELRSADVKFTPECLGFANVPEPEVVHEIMGGALPVTHHPRWKQRVPRDTGAGWDFEDIRDHYLRELFGIDPVELRSFDMNRYLQLSRVVSGEMMSRTYSEWRGHHGHNHGALVWFYKDLWPATGWGVVDSTGTPKPAYYSLKRVWQPRQLTLTDEGLNGLHLHVLNETTETLHGSVEVLLLKEPNVVVARGEAPLQIGGRSRRLLSADEILGGFYDVSYAYRFGPAHHDVVIATLIDAERRPISDAYHFIRRREPTVSASATIEASAEVSGDGKCRVTLSSDRFLHHVRIGAKGFVPDDNYFHLPPLRTKVITFTTTGNPRRDFKADIEAINLESVLTVGLPKNAVSEGT